MLSLVSISARYAYQWQGFCGISLRSQSWVLMALQVFERVLANAGSNSDKVVIFWMTVWLVLCSAAGSMNRERSELSPWWVDQIYEGRRWLWHPTEMSFAPFGSRTSGADRQRFLPISKQLKTFDSERKSSLDTFWRLWLYDMLLLFAWGSISFAVTGSGCQNWLYSPNFWSIFWISLFFHPRMPLFASCIICSSPLPVGCKYCARSIVWPLCLRFSSSLEDFPWQPRQLPTDLLPGGYQDAVPRTWRRCLVCSKIQLQRYEEYYGTPDFDIRFHKYHQLTQLQRISIEDRVWNHSSPSRRLRTHRAN